VYIGSNDGRIYALKTNGTKMWDYDTGNAIKSSPIISNNILYFGSDDGKLYAVDTINGSKYWDYTTGDKVRSSPAIINDTVYVGSDDGKVYAVSKGGNLNWTYDMGKPVKSSPMIDSNDNSLFIGADNGKVACLDTRNGAEKWVHNVTGAVKSTPALLGNKIVFASDGGTVYIVNKFTGNEDWSYNPGFGIINAAFTSSPVTYGNMIYIGANDGSLYALNNDKKSAPTAIYIYYIVVAVVIIIAFLLLLRMIRNRRKEE
jgi:eukaryotic-like serine/threonine-protein kinase